MIIDASDIDIVEVDAKIKAAHKPKSIGLPKSIKQQITESTNTSRLDVRAAIPVIIDYSIERSTIAIGIDEFINATGFDRALLEFEFTSGSVARRLNEELRRPISTYTLNNIAGIIDMCLSGIVHSAYGGDAIEYRTTTGEIIYPLSQAPFEIQEIENSYRISTDNSRSIEVPESSTVDINDTVIKNRALTEQLQDLRDDLNIHTTQTKLIVATVALLAIGDIIYRIAGMFK